LVLTALPTKRSAGRCRPTGEHDADAGAFAYDRTDAGFLLVHFVMLWLVHTRPKDRRPVICWNTAPRPVKARDVGRRDVLQSVRKRWQWENEALFEAT